jgi:hypothetical protein
MTQRKLINNYEVLTPNGFKSFDGIKKTIRTDGIVLHFDDGSSLSCTPEHLVKSKSGFVKSITSLGKSIQTKDGFKVVVEIEDSNEELEYFDLLNVSDGHEYLTSDIVSHNCAFISTKTWNEFADSVLPTVSSDPNSNIVMTSTANGYNHWFDIVDKARRGKSNYVNLEMDWWEVPGRDEDFKRKIIEDEGIIHWNQNYGNEFIGSSKTLLEADALLKLTENTTQPIFVNGDLRIYSQPKKGAKYIILCDLSLGVGEDYHAIQVIEIKRHKFEQVAVLHSNTIPQLQMTNVIYDLATRYNNAYVLFEINKGEEVPSRLYWDLEYENLLTISKKDSTQRLLGFKGKFQVGFETTKKTKPEMLISLKQLVEKNKLIINDKKTVEEFFVFVSTGNSWAADGDYHDDLIMSLGLLGWLVRQEEFKAITNYDVVREYVDEISVEEILPADAFGEYDEFEEFNAV